MARTATEREQYAHQTELVPTRPGQASGVALGETAAIPAGSYDLVRLRLVLDQTDVISPLGPNPCGGAELNCLEVGDGRTQPLSINDPVSQLLIPVGGSTAGPMILAPDAENELSIDRAAVWSTMQSQREGVKILPLLLGTTQMKQTRYSNDRPGETLAP